MISSESPSLYHHETAPEGTGMVSPFLSFSTTSLDELGDTMPTSPQLPACRQIKYVMIKQKSIINREDEIITNGKKYMIDMRFYFF